MKPYCVNIEITGKCNYNCIHCFDGQNKRMEEMSLHKFKTIFDKLEKEKIFYYNLTGGEPLLHKKWREMVAYMGEKKISYSLNTNGSNLSESDVQYLKKQRVNHIKLSLDGPQNIHNEIRQNTQAFDYLVNCITLLKKYQVPFVFQMTLMENNYRYIPETCKIAREFGALGIRINFYKDFNNLTNKSLTMSLRGKTLRETIFQIETLVKATKENSKFKVKFENSLALLFRKRSCCGAGIGKFQIDPNCNVSPCRYLPINMGNLYTSELSTILNHPIINKLRMFPRVIKEGCDNCFANKICGGGCPAFIYNAYENLSKKDPRCWEN